MFAGDIDDGPTRLVRVEVGDVGLGWGLMVFGDGFGLAGAETVEGAADFGVGGARQAAAKMAALIWPAFPVAKKGPGAEVASLRRREIAGGEVELGTRSGGTDGCECPTFPGKWDDPEEG